MANDSYRLQGKNGGVVLAAAGTWTAAADNGGVPASWLGVDADAVLSNFESNLTGSASIEGLTLPVGYGRGGAITGVTVTSGVVSIYF
jgi:hypothetical protein